MKKLFNKIKENNNNIENIKYDLISKVIKFKTIFYTLLTAIIVSIPFILIFVELFKQFPPIVWVYYLIVVLAILTICLVIAFVNYMYYNLLKNYVEKEEVQKIELKYVFLGELLNPFYLIICIVVFTVLTYLLK